MNRRTHKSQLETAGLERLRLFALLALGSAFSLAACSNKAGNLGNTDAAAHDATAANPDATETADAGATDVADAAPPARHLVEVKLFGDMPLDNAVLDPQFDQSSGNWYAIGGFASGNPRGVRGLWHQYPRTPMDMPVYEIQNRMQDPPDTYLLGSVMSVAAPLSASVWIGRNIADQSKLGNAKPSLVATMAETGDERAYDLIPDSTPSVTFDGLVWQRYAGMMTDSAIGIVTMVFQDPAHVRLLITGPVVKSMSAFDLGTTRLTGRSLSRGETRALHAMDEWRHRQLDPRKAPVRPKL
jgi:hypothetical protein